MNIKNSIAVWLSIALWAPLSAQTYNITAFGAKADGKTINTVAIQKTIDAAAAKGGGTVWVPAGTFMTGGLRLRSNITLHLDNGARLLGSPDIKDYPNEHLLWGDSLRNMAITGKGIIDGNGLAFVNADWTAKPRPEPWMRFNNGENLTIRDVSFVRAPSHTLYFRGCDGLVIDAINILNETMIPNTDGLDISNTRNVRISNCRIEAGDDAICLKSSGEPNPKYLVENVVVTNCILKSDDAGLKLGTGSAHLTRNCLFSNCVIQNTRFGLALFMVEGGRIENYRFDNIIIQGQSRHRTEYPVYIDIDKKKEDSRYGQIDGIYFSNLVIETRGKILIGGQKEAMVENIVFDNVRMRIVKAVDLTDERKPKGNRFIPRWEESADFANENANVTIGNARDVLLRNFKITDDRSGVLRIPLQTINVQGIEQVDFKVE